MNPITFPARPVNGGPLTKALPKTGEWCYEPKYNGWRTLVHVPTRTMFNRHGQRLSIATEFNTALDALQTTCVEWADCEALERRHNIGRGCLFVLDIITLTGPYQVPGRSCEPLPAQLHTLPLNDAGRRNRLSARFDLLVMSNLAESHNQHFQPEPNRLYIPPAYGLGETEELWGQMRAFNRKFNCQFYEGLVAKRADSIYPVQLRSPNQEFPFWMKHRWAF